MGHTPFACQVLLSGFPGRTPRGWLGWSSVVLFKVGRRLVLFDTGAHSDRPGLLAGLARAGVRREMIDTVVLSHMHFDHAANVELFPNAEVIVHESTVAYTETNLGQDLALPQSVCTAILKLPALRVVTGEPTLWPGVQLICTPGHTSGCISLVLDQGEGRWVLAADAVKHRDELRAGVADMGTDLAASRASIARIRQLGGCLIPGHDVPLCVDNTGVTPLGPAQVRVEATIAHAGDLAAVLDL